VANTDVPQATVAKSANFSVSHGIRTTIAIAVDTIRTINSGVVSWIRSADCTMLANVPPAMAANKSGAATNNAQPKASRQIPNWLEMSIMISLQDRLETVEQHADDQTPSVDKNE